MAELPVNQIICGDCLEILKSWPDRCVDLVLTDPPYNIGYTYDNYPDELPEEAYVELLAAFQYPFRTVMIHYPEEMMQYLVPALGIPDEVMAWCYNSNLPRQFRLVGFWGCRPDRSRILQPYKNCGDRRIQERKANGSDGAPMYDWFDDIQIVKNVSKEKTEHPCPIPLALMQRIIQLTTDPDQVILDPFCGSGTTCVAAKMLGRRYIGIDISEDYCRIARERLAAADTGVPVKEARAGQMALFGVHP